MSLPKKKILFLCTGNSCRSQMAEGLTRALRGKEFEVYSAGIETHGLNPNAVLVMAEVGIDITSHYSKHIDELKEVDLDLVVTVCDHAAESCPTLPTNTQILRHSFQDPPKLAENAKTKEEALPYYRQVRDEIRDFVLGFRF